MREAVGAGTSCLRKASFVWLESLEKVRCAGEVLVITQMQGGLERLKPVFVPLLVGKIISRSFHSVKKYSFCSLC
jgi:hypothetical protein